MTKLFGNLSSSSPRSQSDQTGEHRVRVCCGCCCCCCCFSASVAVTVLVTTLWGRGLGKKKKKSGGEEEREGGGGKETGLKFILDNTHSVEDEITYAAKFKWFLQD